MNDRLLSIPRHEEIHSVVLNLNIDSAHGSDGFGAFFFVKYWEIINNDVIKVVQQFFLSGWVLPNFNANNLILLPKTKDASNIGHFMPIAISNFKY